VTRPTRTLETPRQGPGPRCREPTTSERVRRALAGKPKTLGKKPRKAPVSPNVVPAAGSFERASNEPAGRPEGLTDRQWAFCLEYMIDLNGTRAAIRAGYAPERARQEAWRLRTKGYVAGAIAGLLEPVGVTKPRLVDELARIAFADIRKAVTWRPDVEVVEGDEGEEPMKVIRSRVIVVDSALMDDDTAAAVASVSQGANGILRVQMHNKVDALEKLARALNHYKEPSPVNVELRPTIILTGRPDTPAAS
jgi:phage terminase small subunit